MSEMVTKLWRRLPRRRDVVTSVGATPAFGAAIADPLDITVERGSGTYLNREISDLQFIDRVLEESSNERNPLLERLRFLSISADVLDQFYSVRIAKLRRAASRPDAYVTADGMTPLQQLRAVLALGEKLMRAQENQWQLLREELDTAGIALVSPRGLGVEDLNWLQHFFRAHVLPVLTPSIVDEEHPFPLIMSGEVCTVFEFPERMVLVPLPRNMSRFIELPGDDTRFLPIEDVLFRFWPDLFPHATLVSHGAFQVLRDNQLALQERSDDLRARVEYGLRQQNKANTVMLKVSETMSESAIAFVAGHLDLFSPEDLAFFELERQSLTHSGRIDVSRLPGIARVGQLITADVAAKFPEHLFDKHTPSYPPAFDAAERDCFRAITEGDVMVHWPYESFDSVVDFLRQSAEDKDVLAIKQTLYRTSDDSPIVEALIDAARAGKSVTTIVELEARENESSNVQLAKRMEAAGVQIIYGLVGLKIHMKATLVVRREDDETVSYTHISTGNYHPGNARIYTDVSFFTKDKVLGDDTGKVFNYITSGTLIPTEKIIVAPQYLRQKIAELIDAEIANVRSGKPAHICIKVNSLTDIQMVDRLYEASDAGVKVDLIVRRHCALRPGVAGMSENIRVKSIVGRFLEHSRVYCFANGAGIDTDEGIVLFGSPDLMPRNLDERVETLVPVEDPALRARMIHEIMHANLIDTAQTWELTESGDYERHPDRDGFCAHHWLRDPTAHDIGRLKT